jgi:uncharacterized membrane protein YeaQ/YmgE (transglycosylase-associated protein family)
VIGWAKAAISALYHTSGEARPPFPGAPRLAGRVPAVGLLGWIVIGFLAGAAARAVIGGAQYGCLTTILLGVLGAVVGGLIFNAFGADSDALLSGAVGSFVTAFFGAVVVLFALRLVSPRRRR